MQFLDFEKPLEDIALKMASITQSEDIAAPEKTQQLSDLEQKQQKIKEKIYKNLSDWQKIQLARHPNRPYSLDYIDHIFTDFVPLHGDRLYADDTALIGGMAKLGQRSVMLLVQQKGRSTKEKIHHQFGMPHPEGYRKALRLMRLAERFSLPVITFIDTPGAYPGIGAEARGQSEAIAQNLLTMSTLEVPIICTIIGEGCSGGALGIGVGDRLLMMQYSYFATISPEGCASILWKRADKAEDAANIMGITSDKLSQYGLIDEIIQEPLGGAHQDHAKASAGLKAALNQHLDTLLALDTPSLLAKRDEKIRQLGSFDEKKPQS